VQDRFRQCLRDATPRARRLGSFRISRARPTQPRPSSGPPDHGSGAHPRTAKQAGHGQRPTRKVARAGKGNPAVGGARGAHAARSGRTEHGVPHRLSSQVLNHLSYREAPSRIGGGGATPRRGGGCDEAGSAITVTGPNTGAARCARRSKGRSLPPSRIGGGALRQGGVTGLECKRVI
jgi:hypothetical protein